MGMVPHADGDGPVHPELLQPVGWRTPVAERLHYTFQKWRVARSDVSFVVLWLSFGGCAIWRLPVVVVVRQVQESRAPRAPGPPSARSMPHALQTTVPGTIPHDSCHSSLSCIPLTILLQSSGTPFNGATHDTATPSGGDTKRCQRPLGLHTRNPQVVFLLRNTEVQPTLDMASAMAPAAAGSSEDMYEVLGVTRDASEVQVGAEQLLANDLTSGLLIRLVTGSIHVVT